MNYREMSVGLTLQKYIHCVWQLTGSPEEARVYGKQMLIPNESAERVFNFADSFPDILHKTVSDPYTSYVVGPITKTGTTDFQGTINLLGITFRPGMAFPFIQASIETIKNSVVPLSYIWQDMALQYDEIKNTSSFEAKLAKIETLCFKKLELTSAKHLERLNYVFSYLNKHSMQQDLPLVQDLAKLTGYSERTLERHFPVYAGLSPKEYLRIRRINNVAKTVLVDKEDIYQAIVTNGFVDYSHLTKELHYFAYKEFTAKPFSHTDFVSSYLAA